MDEKQRLKLDEMLKANDVEDQTDKIRELKHSRMIKADVETMIRFKQRYARLKQTNYKQYEQMMDRQCVFLFQNYTDIYNKLRKDELNLQILAKFISVLERIENGEIDQHEGSYHVGQLLKELYIDSALKKSEKIDAKNAKIDSESEKKNKETDSQSFLERVQGFTIGKLIKIIVCYLVLIIPNNINAYKQKNLLWVKR